MSSYMISKSIHMNSYTSFHILLNLYNHFIKMNSSSWWIDMIIISNSYVHEFIHMKLWIHINYEFIWFFHIWICIWIQGTEVPEVLSALYEPAERSWRTALGQHELEYLLLLVVSCSLHQQTIYIALGVKLFHCSHGKSNRDRYQQNILCESPGPWLRRPVPYPDAEAVTRPGPGPGLESCDGRGPG